MKETKCEQSPLSQLRIAPNKRSWIRFKGGHEIDVHIDGKIITMEVTRGNERITLDEIRYAAVILLAVFGKAEKCKVTGLVEKIEIHRKDFNL